jgi:hypothetical protein
MATKKSQLSQRKHLVIAAAAVLAVVVIAVMVWSRLGSERLLRGAFENLAEAESFSTEAELTLRLPRLRRGVERPFTDIRAQVAGDVRRAESGTAELTGRLYAEAKGRGNVFFADGDVRILENEVLFNLDNLPVFLNRSGSLVKRWTRVEVPLLKTNNMSDIRGALTPALTSLKRTGTEKIDGERLVRFAGTPSPEAEDRLMALADVSSSGSQAWHVLARLLSANTIESLEVWVDSSSDEVRRIRAHFVRPLRDGRTFDFAYVTLSFKDYGREVAIDRPDTKLQVRPSSFARLLGQGDVEEIKTDGNSQ